MFSQLFEMTHRGQSPLLSVIVVALLLYLITNWTHQAVTAFPWRRGRPRLVVAVLATALVAQLLLLGIKLHA